MKKKNSSKPATGKSTRTAKSTNTSERKRSQKAPTKKASAKKKTTAKKRTTAKKKTTAKKSPAKKTTAKKTTKKATTRKPAAKKSPAKKAAPKKAATKKSPTKTTAKKSTPKTAKKPAKKPITKAKTTRKRQPKASGASARAAKAPFILPEETERITRKTSLKKRELKHFERILKQWRDRYIDEISFLSGGSINTGSPDSTGNLSGYSLHMADQGTDNFRREMNLNIVSSEVDILHEIEEALRRVKNGTYGVCQLTGDDIEKARLEAIPYTRFSVAAQQELEKGQTRYRPFGPTLSKTG